MDVREMARQLLPSRRVTMAWTSGRDEDFGGRYLCFHGLRDDEYQAMLELAQAFGKSPRDPQ